MPSSAPAFFKRTEKGACLFVRATPGAVKNQIAGVWKNADGEQRLSVKITAPPDKGKANAAIIKLLACESGLAKSCFEIVAGEASRLKTVAVRGDTKTLVEVFRELVGN